MPLRSFVLGAYVLLVIGVAIVVASISTTPPNVSSSRSTLSITSSYSATNFGISTTTVTTTATMGAGGSSAVSSTQSTACFFAGEPIGVWLRTVSDTSGAPLGGVTFTGANVGNQCGDSSIAPVTTNSTGWIVLPGEPGSYNLTMTYAGRQYPSIDFPMYPVTATVATIDLPSRIFSVDVRTYGTNDTYSGPSATASFGNLSLKMTLASSSVKAGQFLPIRVEFVGPGAWNSSYLFQTLRVTNASGTLVFNATQRIPSLSPMTYTSALRDFVTSNGWNARPYPQPDGVPIQPGLYQVTISAEVAGYLFVATQSVQVVP